ncbi:MAG: hypothetical protein H7173_01135 [Rhodoferax sp.]|nr:hypothetical protein [Pseudorhodobacter sp.]
MPSPTVLPKLAPFRVHEVGGAGAHAFAMVQAGAAVGPVVYICPSHDTDRLLPSGVAQLLPPARLMMVQAVGEVDLLWATEEALRSGAVGFVIAAPQKPLSLTAGRRLQLAAEAGRCTGLLMIRDGMGSNAAQTRWHCAPEWRAPELLGRDSTLHKWSLIKNKEGTLGDWCVGWNEKARAICVVPPVGQRREAAQAAL